MVERRVRVVRPGAQVTMELVPGRVTIILTEDHRIGDIKIEPGPEI